MASSQTPAPINARYFLPFHWRQAIWCAPAMPLLMLVGILAGRPVMGATAAGAALAVGFGAARQLHGQRWGAMGAAVLGMSLAAFAGSLLGQHLILYVPIAGAAAAACAAAALSDEDLWWAVLQMVIAYLIAGYYAGPIAEAFNRGAVVLVGGAVQIGIVMALAQLLPMAPAAAIIRSSPNTGPGLRRAHMARAAICVMISLLITRRLGLSNSYWAPMTALIVLKPRLHETRARGVARLTGTLAGCAVASGYAHLCGGSAWLIGAGAACSATAAYALQKAHYASLTAAITATVVLLLSLGHAPALANAENRIMATLIGGGIALTVAWAAPHAPRLRFGGVDRVGK